MAAYRPKAVFQLKRDPAHPNGSALGSVNCNPTAAATLVDFATCGRRTTTGAAVRELTGDTESGTLLSDVTRAVWKGFRIDLDRNTAKFLRVIEALEAGRGVSLCGSSIATHGTEFQASEKFTGNHQWALTDIRQGPNGVREILVFDPLADGRRAAIDRAPSWIPAPIVREFAGNLDLRSKAEVAANRPREPLGVGRASYAVTEVIVCTDAAGRLAGDDEQVVRLRQGAIRVGGDIGVMLDVKVPIARVRERPRTTSDIVGRKHKGDVFHVFQKIRGQGVAGSHLWYGDRFGSRWVHASLLEKLDMPAERGDDDDPGEDSEAIGLPDGVETPDADDEVLEGVEESVDEEMMDEVPAEMDA